MNYQLVTSHIVSWLCEQLKKTGLKGFVVGVSGGIDSAVVSKLCAMTGKSLSCILMPINQSIPKRAIDHLDNMQKDHSNVRSFIKDLSDPFNSFKKYFSSSKELVFANMQSRIRMVCLYACANTEGYLVVGTGNKVEDYGVMFFTKWGDGGVDVSPIGGLIKSEVYGAGKHLELNTDILKAEPKDDLWEDGRTDEDQIGATYPELEWAMNFCDKLNGLKTMEEYKALKSVPILDERQKEVLEIYLSMHEKGMHKINSIPICDIPR